MSLYGSKTQRVSTPQDQDKTLMEDKTNAAPRDQAAPINWYSSVWDIKTSEKIKTFIWRSLYGGLRVGEQFAFQNIQVSLLCPRCDAIESITHLLFQCPYAAKVWDLAPFPTEIKANDFVSFLEG